MLLAANALARLAQQNRFCRGTVAFVVVSLVLNAAFFVAITPGGPILAYLGSSFRDVVLRFPFLI